MHFLLAVASNVISQWCSGLSCCCRLEGFELDYLCCVMYLWVQTMATVAQRVPWELTQAPLTPFGAPAHMIEQKEVRKGLLDQNSILTEMFAYNAVSMANLQKVPIVVFSQSGYSGQLLSHFRPRSAVFVFTNDLRVRTQLSLPATHPSHSDMKMYPTWKSSWCQWNLQILNSHCSVCTELDHVFSSTAAYADCSVKWYRKHIKDWNRGCFGSRIFALPAYNLQNICVWLSQKLVLHGVFCQLAYGVQLLWSNCAGSTAYVHIPRDHCNPACREVWCCRSQSYLWCVHQSSRCTGSCKSRLSGLHCQSCAGSPHHLCWGVSQRLIPHCEDHRVETVGQLFAVFSALTVWTCLKAIQAWRIRLVGNVDSLTVLHRNIGFHTS